MKNHQTKTAGESEIFESQPAATAPAIQDAAQKLDFHHSLDRVRQAANRGDPRAQHAIRDCLANSPHLCEKFGNAAVHAQMALIELISDGEILTSAAVSRQAQLMQKELAGATPSVLQEIVAQRVVTTWLHLAHTEIEFLQSQKDLGWARYWLRRVEVADKLHRAAIASLLLVRDLLLIAAPASQPMIVESSTQVLLPESPAAVEPTVPDDILQCNGIGANRIARFVNCPSNNEKFGTDEQARVESKTNGFHHRLEDLLPQGCAVHSPNGKDSNHVLRQSSQ